MHTSRRCSVCTVPALYPHGIRTVSARYPHVLSLVANRFATIAQNYCGFYFLGSNSLFSLPSLSLPSPQPFSSAFLATNCCFCHLHCKLQSIRAFPATSASKEGGNRKITTSVVLQKTSDTLSSWWSGTKVRVQPLTPQAFSCSTRTTMPRQGCVALHQYRLEAGSQLPTATIYADVRFVLRRVDTRHRFLKQPQYNRHGGRSRRPTLKQEKACSS